VGRRLDVDVGIPSLIIGAPSTVPPDVSGGTFGYFSLFPAQPTFYQLGFNFDTDLGLLNPNTPS
jgi:hypothetical protein